MNREMLRRRFIAISAAIAGAAALRSAAAAEARKCYVLEKDAEDEWNFVCGDSGRWCDLRKNPERMTLELAGDTKLAQPPRGSKAFTLYFKDERPLTEVAPPAPGTRSARVIYLEVRFPELLYRGRTTDWAGGIPGWKGFQLTLHADGKEILRRTTESAVSTSVGPVEPIAASLRGTSEGRVALLDIEANRPVAAMTFSTKGFAAIYDAASARFAAHRAWLVAGNTCIPGTPAPQCYFTTAACEAVGLADDCFELTMLRRLRDAWLSRTPKGRAEIAAYYDAAPRILAGMARTGETHARMLRLYATVILPGALLVRAGRYAPAHRLYRRAVRRLALNFPA